MTNWNISQGSNASYKDGLPSGVNNNGNTIRIGTEGSSASRVSTNQVASFISYPYKEGVRDGQWNEESGSFSPTLSSEVAGGWSISDASDQSSNLVPKDIDKAVNDKRYDYGRLTYIQGGAIPKQDTYRYSSETTINGEPKYPFYIGEYPLFLNREITTVER